MSRDEAALLPVRGSQLQRQDLAELVEDHNVGGKKLPKDVESLMKKFKVDIVFVDVKHGVRETPREAQARPFITKALFKFLEGSMWSKIMHNTETPTRLCGNFPHC